VTLTANGEVSDYTDAVQQHLMQNFAAALSSNGGPRVTASDITLRITAGSVNLEFTIQASSQAAATQMGRIVTQATTADLQGAIGNGVTVGGTHMTITGTAMSSVVIASSGSGSDDDDLSTGAIIGIAVGGTVVLVLIIVLLVCMCKPKKKEVNVTGTGQQMTDIKSAVPS